MSPEVQIKTLLMKANLVYNKFQTLADGKRSPGYSKSKCLILGISLTQNVAL
jgi:hypothetical protein